MNFRLDFQDPTAKSAFLLERILQASDAASRGGAVFAFASESGVRMLIGDPDFRRFLARSRFALIVGLDAVTTPTALQLLAAACQEFPGLDARAFLHQQVDAIFHPKLAWFASHGRASIIVGSGNLTRGGLLGNWEAFGSAIVVADAYAELDETWDAWRRTHKSRLFSVTDPHVMRRASRNLRQRPRQHEELAVENADRSIWIPDGAADVLIAEIPAGGARWNQANFDLNTFRTFFQLEPGQLQRVALFPVTSDGAVGPLELRPSVDVKSQNYRIELGQAAGIAYPVSGRPIGLFLRLATRRFRYRLLLPGDPDHKTVTSLLDQHRPPRANRLRRLQIVFDQFRTAAPHVAL